MARGPIAAILLLLGLAACAQQAGPAATAAPDTELAGVYSCAPDPEPTDPGWPGPETWTLAEDGTLTIMIPDGGTEEGTWTIEGDRVTIHFQGQDDPFTVEGENLVAEVADPEGATWTCRPT
jgi:hypothetical protein